VIDTLGGDRIRGMFGSYHIFATEAPTAASHPARAQPDASLIAPAAGAGFAAIGLDYRQIRPEQDALELVD
jgi:hypothetical protein